MKLSFRLVTILLAVISNCWSQQISAAGNTGDGTRTQAPPNAPAVFSERIARYQLCAGDVMDLHFEFTPEFDQPNVSVQSDGFVTLSGIGDVQVAGLTVPEVRKKFVESYGKILANPEITVTLKDFNKPYFIAEGQVGKPGKYELRAKTTVIEAIGIAGGFTESSKHSDVWVFHRLANGTVQSKHVNVKQMMAGADLKEDISLFPGDTIYVPQNTASKIKGFVQPSVGATVTPVRP